MTEILEKLFEHNHWANQQIIRACAGLSDEQLDRQPRSVTKGSIRRTLEHLVGSQQRYLLTLTAPVEAREREKPSFDGLAESESLSSEGLLALVRQGASPTAQLQTKGGQHVEAWVILLQAINHATEHREQIKSMLSDLGQTPPDIDGWDYGTHTGALTPMPGG